ncbi:MaoC family dehydratase N-terminal domain-containing protein [Siccirubricoccus sp. KC 17139]|uniref:MaoC family dehydratase N-terminal domain-containing protein n=1 Tax=Siccirubricoccus soli TaxID=2899147 RepID=A0ABT1D319_9PROT|nr:MaoC family dehydratase N-terminal domain-containing protein [Siccirubricoccus soli]MCO6416316.1 MaoC family dehydratase N-terminal domain-containing protein [Siccirubricoccus soli]MCP2682450.1 MaoC family dehydratase N-terminal domain-containing protein [Siccirubricoccus soli]
MDALQEWIGRSEVVEDEASLTLLRRLAALLDQDPMALQRGAPMPEGWHVVLFGPLARQSGLGPDGHAAKGEFLPPVPLPRRMFAGRRTWFNAPIAIGAEVRRVSRIAAITPKEGRSGKMIFVTIRHGIESEGRECVVEEQDLVYRDAATPGAKPAEAPLPELPADAVRESFTPDTTLLFRYSAATNNGHRIHYDADYARQVEGYPALVVNGGITTTKLTELAKRLLPGPVAKVTTRAGRPLFVGREVTLAAQRKAPGKLRLWALDDGGRLAFETLAECAA